MSGDTFFTQLSEVYSNGLYFIWAQFGELVCFLLIAIFFAPRMGEFLGKLSIAQAMGDLYGKNVQIITSISAFIGATGMIAMQLKVAGLLFEYCFGMGGFYGIIMSGLIITMYSGLGGIRSVTFTDVLQLFTFGTIIPTIAFFILSTAGNVDIVLNTLTTSEIFDYKKVFDFSNQRSVYYLFLFIFIAAPGFNPAIFQRIAMAKSTTQVRQSFTIAAFTCFVLTSITFWIGTIILATKPNIDGNNIVKHIIFDYSFKGIRGLTSADIMAVVMSTADSYINSTSVLVINDFCKPIRSSIIKNELIEESGSGQ
ncbi:MAG: sodium:solute symporter family protein, partial [Rickettsiales bacterium]